MREERTQAYTSAINGDGSIFVYTGSCGEGSEASDLWRFSPDQGSTPSSGSWEQLDTPIDPTATASSMLGAHFLSSAVSFAAMRNASAGLYVFGGMCPENNNGNVNDWVKSATYSNKMLHISPDASDTSSKTSYDLSLSASRGPPIPEAGFSMTSLTPAVLQAPENSGSQVQNQNFVLVGGHTQQAFINMSQVALFSLPEESWTFVPIDDPDPPPKTDLATRASPIVEPRSGHTAVLTSDGTKIVVFGGWVGDVTSFANPQLAILDVGNGYGGTGDWKWNIPDTNGPGPSTNQGLFGHGAIMLPGNVMMVIGGYQISQSSSSNGRRSITPTVNSQNYYFNLTSNTWVDSYTMPKPMSKEARPGTAEKEQMAVSKKVGLGAGLTLAIIALVALTVFAFWYTRRLQRQRTAREAELRDLAAGARRDHAVGDQQPSMQERSMGMTVVDWVGGPSGRRDSRYDRVPGEMDVTDEGDHTDSTTQAARTGLLFEIPSPTRGLRRSLHARGTYQPAPRFDENRVLGRPGRIHRIDERDEDEEVGNLSTREQIETQSPDNGNILDAAPKLDPFRDPEDSRSPSPQGSGTQKDEVGRWIKEWATAEAIARQQAPQRGSPDKADRTSSTLSDQSAHSAVSQMSWPYSLGSMSRSISQRSAKIFSAGNVHQPGPSSLDTRRAQNLARTPSVKVARSQAVAPPNNPRSPPSAETYITAPTDSQALLSSPPPQLSPVRLNSRTRGWMGSMRRVLVGGDRSTSASPEHEGPSNDSSPTKSHHDMDRPSRRLSTGPNPYQVRRGPGDWQTEHHQHQRTGSLTHEDDWDIESAVENRVVQVMYTVPRDRLRVVNQGPDGDGVSIPSRDGSVKDMQAGTRNVGQD